MKKGAINVTRTIECEDETTKKYSFQEKAFLTKTESENEFIQNSIEKTYKIDNDYIIEDEKEYPQTINSTLKDLVEIMNQYPNGYKDLISLKTNFQSTQNL